MAARGVTTRDVLLQIISQFESKGVDEAKKGLLDLSKLDKKTFLGGLGGAFKGMASNVLGLLNPLKMVRGLLGTVGAGVHHLGGIFKIALGVVAGTAISTVTSALAQLAQAPVMVAARVEVLETVLWRIGQQAGFAQDQLQGFVEGLKETGITTQQALNNLTRMIQANLDLSKATDLARVAQNAAVIAGTNSSEAFERLLHGITTFNPIVLRTMGIVIDMQSEIKRYAAAHDVAVEAISATTKQQIAFDAVLRAGQTIAGSYESAMTQVGKKLTSLPRYIEEAQLALGRGLTPILSAAVDVVGDLMKKLGAYFEEIQPTLTAFSERVGAGLKALYEKGQAAVGALIEGFSRVRPYLVEVGEILGHYLPQVAARLKLLWIELKNALGGLASAASAYLPQMASLWTFFTDTAKASLETVLKILDGFRLALKGQGEQAAKNFSDAMANGLAVLIIIWEDYVSQALTWGYNLVAEFAQGMINAASQWITAAVDYVGGLISQFLAAFSAPKKGILRGIAEWGRGLINEYFKGFTLADFSLLDKVGGMIKSALQSAVALGDLPEQQLVPVFRQVRELVAGLIADFRKTGEISEEALSRIGEVLGEGSEEMVKYLRLQLEHQKALKDLEAVAEEYAAAEAAGFVPAELKEKLKKAQEAADAKAEELSWQEALIRAQQDSVDLQVQQMRVMQQLAEVIKDVGDKLGKALKPAADPWAKFVQDYEEDMAVLEEKRRLGLISEKEYLEGLAQLQGRYIEQAIRMDKPYDVQLEALRRIRAQLEGVGGEVAGPDFVFPLPDMDQFEQDLDAGIAEAFEGVSGRFEEAKEKGRQLMANLLVGAQEALTNLPSLVREKITEAWDALREQYPVIDEAIGKAQTFAAAVLTVFTVAKDTILSAVDVIVGTTWPKLRGAFDTITETLGEFGISWGDVWDAVKRAVGIVAVIIGAILLALVGVIVGVVNGIASALQTMIQGWHRLSTGIRKIIDGLALQIAGWINVIKGVLEGDWQRVIDGFKQIGEGWKTATEGLLDAVAGFFTATFGTIIEAVGGFIEGVVEFFQNLKDRLVGGSIIPEMVDEAIAAFTRLRDRATELMAQARDWITEKIGGIAASFEAVKTAIEGVIGKLADLLSSLASAVIPDWLLPGSATPFEAGLWGILNAMSQLSQVAQGFFVFQQMRMDLEALVGEGGMIPFFVTRTVALFTELRAQVIRLTMEMSNRVVQLILTLRTRAIQLILSLRTRAIQLFTQTKTQVIQLVTDMVNEVEQLIADMVQSVLDSLIELRDESEEILNEFAEIFESMAERAGEAVVAITAEIDKLIGKLEDLIDKAKEAEDALQGAGLLGESPSGMELSLRGIARAMADLPDLTTQWTRTLNVQAMPVPAVATAGGGTVNNSYYYLGEGALSFPSVRTARDSEDVMAQIQEQVEKAGARASVPGGV